MNWKTNGFLLLESLMVHAPVVIPFLQYITIFSARCPPSAEKWLAQALDLPLASSVVTPLCTQGYKGTEGQFALNRLKFYVNVGMLMSMLEVRQPHVHWHYQSQAQTGMSAGPCTLAAALEAYCHGFGALLLYPGLVLDLWKRISTLECVVV